ncbi:MAG: TolC family protein [Saprospiraceae bacterium]
MKLLIRILAFGLTVPSALAQITPEAAVQAALQSHPLMKATALDLQAKKYGEKAAFNLPNPEVNAESPTGEFYTVGVSQSFEFPTVYSRQKQVAKAETALALAGQGVSENDLRHAVRSLYLEAQLAEYQVRQWTERDSLYQAIATTAGRQFTGGEIDFLQKTLAENEAGQVHQERLAAEQMAGALRSQLATFTGLADLGMLLPLSADTVGLVAIPDVAINPSVTYERQVAEVAAQQVRLAQSRMLPNFSLGYLNQGARSTPIDYRFRASVGLPLWLGQYRAGTNAAKAEREAAKARAEAQSQSIALELIRVRMEAATALGRVQYHQREALPRSRSLIAAAARMRAAGQVDYATFLRTLDQAYAIQREYAAQVQSLNTAQLRLRYLSGN